MRARSNARIVAITGSVGKTSTKDILAALLRPHVRLVAAEAGYNNEVGLPLTLGRIEPDTQVVVTEMGMRGAGQIRELAEIARPDLAVITAIAPVHLELLGTIENVARAKAELLDALPAGGIAVVPANAPALEPFIPSGLDVRRFEPPEVDVRDGHAHVRYAGREIAFSFAARHQAANAIAASDRVRGARRPAPRRARRRIVLALALRGERVAGRRSPDQRRLERESGRDARGAPIPRRAGRGSKDDRDPRRNG